MNGNERDQRFSFIRALVLKPIIDHFDDNLGDISTICRQNGVSITSLHDPYAPIPLQSYLRILEQAAILSGDPVFGARIGFRSRPGNIAPIGLLAIQLSTIERALMAMVRYSSALQSGTRMKLEHDDQHLVLNYLITEPNGAPLRHDAEFSLASTCGLIRTAFDLRWRPLEIGFCHPAPSSLAKAHLRTLFGAPVLFGQPVNRIIMPIAAARRTYRTDDPDMIAMTERHLVDLMQRTARATTVGEQVAVHVAMSLGSGELGIETIAAALQMSPRSLQRKLADEGTTLSRIVQKYRHERADALLVEGVMSIDEIATALGYADGTVFWRAYRGWTGFSPNQRKKSGEHSIAS